MANPRKSKWIENVVVLALIGIMAGVAGGFAIGLVSLHSSSSSSSSSSSGH
jgi:hypothetical protein